MLDWATRAFSVYDGEGTRRSACETVGVVRPPVTGTVIISDADVVADYVASVGDACQHQLTEDWSGVVESTRQAAQAGIDRHGRITTKGETGAFICR
jgi:hypothetical protein